MTAQTSLTTNDSKQSLLHSTSEVGAPSAYTSFNSNLTSSHASDDESAEKPRRQQGNEEEEQIRKARILHRNLMSQEDFDCIQCNEKISQLDAVVVIQHKDHNTCDTMMHDHCYDQVKSCFALLCSKQMKDCPKCTKELAFSHNVTVLAAAVKGKKKLLTPIFKDRRILIRSLCAFVMLAAAFSVSGYFILQSKMDAADASQKQHYRDGYETGCTKGLQNGFETGCSVAQRFPNSTECISHFPNLYPNETIDCTESSFQKGFFRPLFLDYVKV